MWNISKIISKGEARDYSISVFFPCHNEKGNIGNMVFAAKKVMGELGIKDFEITVVDNYSTDGSRDLLLQLKNDIPELKLIFHEKNMGYGGSLRSGFKNATKELVFYTDGDMQYDVGELPLLFEKLTDDVDAVNGYKIKRSDPWHRIVIGGIYQRVIRFVFWLPIRDPDCDFRLIRRRVFDKIELKSDTAAITVELVKKIQNAGFRFAEVGVSHRRRVYGESQFFNFNEVAATLLRLGALWLDLMVFKKK